MYKNPQTCKNCIIDLKNWEMLPYVFHNTCVYQYTSFKCEKNIEIHKIYGARNVGYIYVQKVCETDYFILSLYGNSLMLKNA